jgi:hypothetical protein
MRSSRYLSILASVLTAALLGCASAPQSTSPSAGASAQSGSQTAAAGGAAQAGTLKTTAASTSQAPATAPVAMIITPELLKQAQAMGYSPEMRGGNTIFCKEETELGSRFTRKTCLSEHDMSTVIEQQQQQQDVFRNHPSPLSSH